MEVIVTIGTIRKAKLQSNHHRQQTNTHLFTGWMPFLSPNQQCHSTEGVKYHIPRTCLPHLPWGLPTFSLTTKGSWLVVTLGEGCQASLTPVSPAYSGSFGLNHTVVVVVVWILHTTFHTLPVPLTYTTEGVLASAG